MTDRSHQPEESARLLNVPGDLFPQGFSRGKAAFIAQTARGDISAGSVEFLTIYAVGATLFVITLILNAIAISFVRRFRQEYD